MLCWHNERPNCPLHSLFYCALPKAPNHGLFPDEAPVGTMPLYLAQFRHKSYWASDLKGADRRSPGRHGRARLSWGACIMEAPHMCLAMLSLVPWWMTSLAWDLLLKLLWVQDWPVSSHGTKSFILSAPQPLEMGGAGMEGCPEASGNTYSLCQPLRSIYGLVQLQVQSNWPFKLIVRPIKNSLCQLTKHVYYRC